MVQVVIYDCEPLAGSSFCAGGALLFSWGKDHLLAAGEEPETICGLRSNMICGHYRLKQPDPAPDARADAEGVAVAVQFLLRAGRSALADITGLAPD
jgi:hypothetical protein